MDENDQNSGAGGPGDERPPQPPPHGDLSGTPVGGAAGGAGAGPGPGGVPNSPTAYSQQIAHSPVSARVPERVARGVMTTGVIVLDSPNEVVLDFLQCLSTPPSTAAPV